MSTLLSRSVHSRSRRGCLRREGIGTRERPGDPLCLQVRQAVDVVIVVARTYSDDWGGIRNYVAIEVLPECPGEPSGRQHRGWTILRESQPAVLQSWIGLVAQLLLEIRPTIGARPGSGDLLDMRHKVSGILKRHAGARFVRFEIKDQKHSRGRLNRFEKEFRLRNIRT